MNMGLKTAVRNAIGNCPTYILDADGNPVAEPDFDKWYLWMIQNEATNVMWSNKKGRHHVYTCFVGHRNDRGEIYRTNFEEDELLICTLGARTKIQAELNHTAMAVHWRVNEQG
ncbi:MAG: hypothetical protein ACYTFW_10270 [Planctomycetota bacterium]|jgi:hypothetical protein